MKSPVARKLLWTGPILTSGYIALVLLADAALRLGACRGGRMIMNPAPGTEPPVRCAHLPDALGTVANELVYSVFAAILLSPILLIVWGCWSCCPRSRNAIA